MSNRILVVDDEPDSRFSLQLLLSGRGYEVEEAEDGEVALGKLNASPFDLVILDLLMPNLTGYQVIERLTPAVSEHTAIVLLTAKGEDRDIMKGYSMGATYYITKPFKNQRVLDIADYLLGNLTSTQKKALEERL
jgi:DNA-binding response OmpR family regulator